MSTFRKLLLSLLLVSLTGSAFGAGTFASFTASTTNASSTFATGTIVLSNDVAGGAAGTCFSTGSGVGAATGTFTNNNTNATCEALFPGSLTKPADIAQADINLENVGNLNSTLKVNFVGLGASGACLSADDTTSGNAYHGDGDLCPTVLVKVQQFHTNARDVTTGANYQCLFDSTSGDNTSGSTCDNLATLNTLDAANTITIGSLNPGAANTRFVRIYFELPSSAGNNMMGRKVDFSLVWTLDQV